MSKCSFLAILSMASVLVTTAQGNQSAFIEVGGNGLFLSANYDARFAKKENGLGYRLGIGAFPGIGNNNNNNYGVNIISFSTILTVPAGINYLTGKGPHHFESGVGLTYASGSFSLFNSDEAKENGFLFIPSVGYRYAEKGKGFQLRVFLSPLIISSGSTIFGGISGGFKW